MKFTEQERADLVWSLQMAIADVSQKAARSVDDDFWEKTKADLVALYQKILKQSD